MRRRDIRPTTTSFSGRSVCADGSGHIRFESALDNDFLFCLGFRDDVVQCVAQPEADHFAPETESRLSCVGIGPKSSKGMISQILNAHSRWKRRWRLFMPELALPLAVQSFNVARAAHSQSLKRGYALHEVDGTVAND